MCGVKGYWFVLILKMLPVSQFSNSASWIRVCTHAFVLLLMRSSLFACYPMCYSYQLNAFKNPFPFK